MEDLKKPLPYSFSSSQFWDGNDGSWSTFAIRVGTPAQTFRTLPATTGQEIWVPLPEACPNNLEVDCTKTRGAFNSLFRPNNSSSWKELGIYDLVLNQELNYSGGGLYGLEKVGLQIANSGGIELDTQVVAGIATTDFYLGIFGLGPKPLNFSNLDHPVPSLMQALKNHGQIPSISYGYTAGASYKSPQVFGSLTLGGYDKSRFIPSQIKYSFDPDDSRPLSIFIESITTSNTLTSSGRTTLLDDSHKTYALIDSTIPHLWLPKEVCDQFQQAFGLQYDSTNNFYRLNHTTRDALLSMNASITIGLGYDTDPLNRTSISLPYAAFDLKATPPIYPNATYYFPIRRGENSSQYRLGRVFLQEAYIIADYERSQFSIHQARFKTPLPTTQLVPISPPKPLANVKNETANMKQHEQSLTRGDIAGIVVGCWAAIAIFLGLLLRIYRNRRRRRAKILDLHNDKEVHVGMPELPPETRQPPEIQSCQVHEMFTSPTEMNGTPRSPILISDESKRNLVELPTEINEI